MPAEIESIAYTGKTPWHGIGEVVEPGLLPQEILVKAGLDWTVSKRPIWAANVPDATAGPFTADILMHDHYALVRDSDNKVLGICGSRYQPFQNTETFEFFSKFVEAGQMRMEVAGSLRGGKWVWALARLDEGAFELVGNDKNYTYLLLCSPHVWGEALSVMFTAIRVVCWNTLTEALNSALTSRFRLMHHKSFADVRSLAELTVEQALLNKAVYEQKARILAEAKVVDVQKLYDYIARIVQPDLVKDGMPANPLEFKRKASDLLLNYNSGPGAKLDSARGTWWGAYNAATYHLDHQIGRIGPDKQLYESWLGSTTAVLKRKALDIALVYAQAA